MKGYINRLFVLQSEELIKLIAGGLQSLKDSNIYLDGKLELLAHYVQAYPKGISPNYLSAKSRSFFEFMGDRLNDPVPCVVGKQGLSKKFCFMHSLIVFIFSI